MKKSMLFRRSALALLGCMAILPAYRLAPGVKKYRTLDLLYVDNSKIRNHPILSLAMIEQIDSISQKLAGGGDGRFLMFLSNSVSPLVGQSPNEVRKIVARLREGNTTYPNLTDDKAALRNALFAEDFSVESRIRFHLFITNDLLDDMSMNTGSAVFRQLAREVMLVAAEGRQLPVEINICHPAEGAAKLDEAKVRSVFEFYNKDAFKMDIKYSFTQN